MENSLMDFFLEETNRESTDQLKAEFNSRKRFTWAIKHPQNLKLHEMLLINNNFPELSISKLIKEYDSGKLVYTDEELEFLSLQK